jgi:hypothetical protein
MELKRSLPNSQVPATCPYPESVRSSSTISLTLELDEGGLLTPRHIRSTPKERDLVPIV